MKPLCGSIFTKIHDKIAEQKIDSVIVTKRHNQNR